MAQSRVRVSAEAAEEVEAVVRHRLGALLHLQEEEDDDQEVAEDLEGPHRPRGGGLRAEDEDRVADGREGLHRLPATGLRAVADEEVADGQGLRAVDDLGASAT